MSLFPSGRRNPFWSAVIPQVMGEVSVPSDTVTVVVIQPPAGETWLVSIDFSMYVGKGFTNYLGYSDYDGTTARLHKILSRYATTNYDYGHYFYFQSLNVLKVLTNSLYARLVYFQTSGVSVTGRYGYSGFKLSQPLWKPRRMHNPDPSKPWERPKTKPLPSEIKALDKYAVELLGIDIERPNEYDLAIILEEDTKLAVDEAGFPVERLTACVKADILADYISKFKTGEADPVATGYRKYLDKWKDEGIDLGV